MSKPLASTYFAKFCLSLVLMGMALSTYASNTPGPSDYYASPQINTGEKLVLEIAFDQYPMSSSGDPIGLFINFGGLNTASDLINLYVAGQLLGSTTSYPTPLALFQSPLSPRFQSFFSGINVDSMILESVFNGTNHAFFEIIPTIDPGTAPFVYFSGYLAGAVTFSGSSFEQIFPSATLIKETVLPSDAPLSFAQVPEPSTPVMLLTALPLLLLATKKRQKLKSH